MHSSRRHCFFFYNRWVTGGLFCLTSPGQTDKSQHKFTHILTHIHLFPLLPWLSIYPEADEGMRVIKVWSDHISDWANMDANNNEPTAGSPHIPSPESLGLLGNMVHLKVNRCSGWVCILVQTYVCPCLVNGKQFLGGAIPFKEFQGKPIICLSPLDASCFPVG